VVSDLHQSEYKHPDRSVGSIIQLSNLKSKID
jgi:hypothetical protein